MRITILAMLLGLIAAGGSLVSTASEGAIQTGSATSFGEANGEKAVAEGPSALFDVSQNAVETFVPLTLDAAASFVQTGSIALYAWDLDGDGSFDKLSDGPTLVHAYADDGLYAVRLQITDEFGVETLSGTVEVTVTNRPPTARFSVSPGSGTNGDLFAFRDASSDRDGSIVSRDWSFGDGSTSSEQAPTHAFVSSGEYLVSLVVTDEDGASSAAYSRAVTVTNVLPKAEFVSPSSAQVGVPVAFVDASVDPSNAGRIVHVAWDFGDGTYAAGGPSAGGFYTHTYRAPGEYTVTLYVIDEDGGLASTHTTISVLAVT
ncbi:PKD domain-containing protein [Candidatus Bipolaricaulota bacterium]